MNEIIIIIKRDCLNSLSLLFKEKLRQVPEFFKIIWQQLQRLIVHDV